MCAKNIIKFKDLYYEDFEIIDIYAMRQKWIKGVTFRRNLERPRPRTGIILLNKCEGVYTDKSGDSFVAPPQSVVCLPYGSVYTCLNADCSNTIEDAILIEFNILINGKIHTFSDKSFLVNNLNISLISKHFDNVVQACESSTPSKFAIKTALYNLLLYVCTEKKHKYQKRFSSITTGIELLESDPLSKLSIEEIAKTCNVSTSYFRRLFKEYSGKSPSDYRINLRMDMAKALLENDETTIEQITELLNFENVSYFCRIFKNKFGMTPSQYKQSKNMFITKQMHSDT